MTIGVETRTTTMSDWVCGHMPGMPDVLASKAEEATPCGDEANWFATFYVGSWRAHVPLCDEHVRHFALMAEAAVRAQQMAGGTTTKIQLAIGIAEELYSMQVPGEKYTLMRQIYRCEKCELPIVRSLEEPGKWVIAGQPEAVEQMHWMPEEAGPRKHEHRPG